MGIKALGLTAIKRFTPCDSLLSLSYPDMVMSQDELEGVAGFRTFCETDYGGWHGRKHKLPDTAEVFAKLGVKQTRYVDIAASRGVEDIVDLNAPADLGQHDIVLDCGTTEHCANIWQATVIAANAVKVGGVIVHTPPLTMLNHGFYCPQPTFYFDLYTQNGWRIEAMLLTDGEQFADAPRTARFKAPPEFSVYVIAKRLTDTPLTYPTQTKYLNNPGLK